LPDETPSTVAFTDEVPPARWTKEYTNTEPAPELSVVTGKGPNGNVIPTSVARVLTAYWVFGAKWDRFTVTLQKCGSELGVYVIETVRGIATSVPPCAA
jgi:hypothetical protein